MELLLSKYVCLYVNSEIISIIPESMRITGVENIFREIEFVQKHLILLMDNSCIYADKLQGNSGSFTH